jgi:hypothetical protein
VTKVVPIDLEGHPIDVDRCDDLDSVPGSGSESTDTAKEL